MHFRNIFLMALPALLDLLALLALGVIAPPAALAQIAFRSAASASARAPAFRAASSATTTIFFVDEHNNNTTSGTITGSTPCVGVVDDTQIASIAEVSVPWPA